MLGDEAQLGPGSMVGLSSAAGDFSTAEPHRAARGQAVFAVDRKVAASAGPGLVNGTGEGLSARHDAGGHALSLFRCSEAADNRRNEHSEIHSAAQTDATRTCALHVVTFLPRNKEW